MARLMSSTELYERLDRLNEEFILVDVLPSQHFQQEHIPGAINIPLEELAEKASTLPKNKRVIVYGDEHKDAHSEKAAELLESLGFRKVADFDGGLDAWKHAGYKTSAELSKAS